MITMKDWKLDVPCSQPPIGYDGENLASRVAIYTDSGPEWTYALFMEYSDGSILTLPLTWNNFMLFGDLTAEYLAIPGHVKVTVQGENGGVIKKSNMGLVYVAESIQPGGGDPVPEAWWVALDKKQTVLIMTGKRCPLCLEGSRWTVFRLIAAAAVDQACLPAALPGRF